MNRSTTGHRVHRAAGVVAAIALLAFLAGCAGTPPVEQTVPRACVTELPGMAPYTGEQCRSCENVHVAAPGEPRRCGLAGTRPSHDDDGDGIPNADDACPGTREEAEVLANGCERIALDGVQFENDSASLTGSAREMLEQHIETLQRSEGIRIEVAGHTDSQGAKSYNQALSLQRARSVRAFFIERGIDPERLAAEGYGEAQPVADNSSAAGRERNRRVELRVIPRKAD